MTHHPRHGDRPPLVTTRTESALTPAEQALHRNLRGAVRQLQRDLVRVCYYLLQIRELHIHRKLGFATMAAYGEAVAGLTARQTEDFIALARRLRRYPDVAQALAAGKLSWTQARLITSRAEPHEQQHWISRAGELSMRQLEAALPPRQPDMPLPGATAAAGGQRMFTAASAVPRPDGAARPQAVPASIRPERAGVTSPPGAPPSPCPAPPPPAWHHWNIRWTAEQYAVAGSLMAYLQAASGCPAPEIILEALECSATRVASGDVGADGGTRADRVRPAGPPFLLVILACPDCGGAAMPTGRGELPVAGALLRRARCDSVIETGDGERRQVIPPRLRRRVMQRARYRCEAPGCLHASFLEIHHRTPLAAGGRHEPGNLVVLCARCHHRIHERDREAGTALRAAPA